MCWLSKESNNSINFYKMDFNLMRKKNYHTKLVNNIVQPYFENLEEHLIAYIDNSAYVIGCVAWLTNRNIIEALENIKGVKIIVNKEEYISSKMQTGQKFSNKCLQGRYNDIPDFFENVCDCCGLTMRSCKNFKTYLNDCVDADNELKKKSSDNMIKDVPTISRSGAILTCGIVNNYSKMHHKFLIFFNNNMQPLGVWTGSYNFSTNGNFSLENAIYICDKEVILEYIKEFMAIYPYSESYNWNSGILCSSLYRPK